MRQIKFGVGIYGTDNAREAVELARTADALGYDRFWIGDSHMIWRELYVLAGAIAMATKKIHFGPGVTHPAVRHLTVTASAMATLHELTAGRVFLGFGVGASGPANVGMQPVTATEFEANILTLKQLLRGEPVEFNGTEVKCLFPCGEIPIYIGTRAPRVMKMACRLTAGFIHAGASDSLIELVRQLQSYAQAAGRKPGDVEFIYRLPCAIDDDTAQARSAVKGVVARTAMTQLGRLFDRGQLEDPEDRSAIARMRQEYDTYHHMDAAHGYLVRDQWLERFALAGRADHLRAKVQEFLAAGIDELTIIPCGPSKQTTLESFARDIMDKI
jgi:alkanesulfonate monooxygenase SsuD/methylene tetrahydromethanopterin reductase-like flavin-dependent oxidoreductase (luciferase family)